MTVYAICLAVVGLLLAYSSNMTEATLALGRELSDSPEGTGFQDAITPQWDTNLGLFGLGSAVALVCAGLYFFGWMALFAIFGLLAWVAFCKALLIPKRGGRHYRKLIVESMIRRHADYVRDGDQMRADAMKTLLDRVDYQKVIG